MKISKQIIKRIIKEELEKVLGEQDLSRRDFMKGGAAAAAQGALGGSAAAKSKCPGVTIIMKPNSNFFELMRTPHPGTNTYLDITLLDPATGKTWNPGDDLNIYLMRTTGSPRTDKDLTTAPGYTGQKTIDFGNDKEIWKANTVNLWYSKIGNDMGKRFTKDLYLGSTPVWIAHVKDTNINVIVRKRASKSVVDSFRGDELFDIQEAPRFSSYFCN